MSIVNDHNKPADGTYDSGTKIYQGNYFSSYYFYNLKEMYFGYNTHGSCGYVATAMLLSYYDTYLDDNIIDEQYDKETNISNLYLPDITHSPGIKK